MLESQHGMPWLRGQVFHSYGIGQTGFKRLNETEKTAQANLGQAQESALSSDRSITLRIPDDQCIAYARTYLPQTWREPSLWQLPTIGSGVLSCSVEQSLAQHACISLARTLFAYRFRQHELLMQGLDLYRVVIAVLQRRISLQASNQYKYIVGAAIALRAFDVSIHTEI